MDVEELLDHLQAAIAAGEDRNLLAVKVQNIRAQYQREKMATYPAPQPQT